MTNTRKLQQGISLIESLVAIVVLSVGILGLIGFQLRTLADTQTSVKRAHAIKLIEDLSERLKVNPYPLSTTVVNNLVTGFGPVTGTIPNCETSACTSSQLAKFDIARWKDAVAATLPLGQASVFAVADETDPQNRRQLGVMVSWRENEKTNDTDYKNVFAVDNTTATCPTDRICHLQYIQLTARCGIQKNVSGQDVVDLLCPRPTFE